MKGILVFVLVTILILVTAGGAWYYFTDGEMFGTDDSTSSPPSSSQTTDNAWSTSQGEDPNCPEGYVCFGGDGIPTVPTVKLGSNDVYAAEGEAAEEPEVPEPEEEPTPVEQQTAAAGQIPKNVTVTNKDFRLWSVTWVTEEETEGYIKYGIEQNQLSKKGYDDRDSSPSNIVPRYTHHVSIVNTDDELEVSGLTYYFTIVSDGVELKDGEAPHSYQNAPLTSTPSLPRSVTVKSDDISSNTEDYYVVARLSDSYGDKSTSVSEVVSLSEVDLVVGTARTEGLSSYFPDSDDNLLEVKIYGPYGYTGYASGVKVGDVGDGKLNVPLTMTGYADSNFASSAGSSYTIEEPVVAASPTPEPEPEPQETTTTTTTTTTTSQEPEYQAPQETPQEPLPATGIEDEWALKALYGILLSIIGLLYLMAYIIWRNKSV